MAPGTHCSTENRNSGLCWTPNKPMDITSPSLTSCAGSAGLNWSLTGHSSDVRIHRHSPLDDASLGRAIEVIGEREGKRKRERTKGTWLPSVIVRTPKYPGPPPPLCNLIHSYYYSPILPNPTSPSFFLSSFIVFGRLYQSFIPSFRFSRSLEPYSSQ